MHNIVFVDADELGQTQQWACACEPDGTVWLFIRQDRVSPALLKEIWQVLLAVRPALAAA